ncbi:class I SAM-dependent methyltransferase [Novosphingobium sp.]|uniref:class I SAM-dependent methyltransferase n=1 Tax=Novosphingobium sp. TaxID=1874826 RepID=UPI0038B6C550
MTSGAEWQAAVGRNWADLHVRTDRSFSNLTPHLSAAISRERGVRVVDVGCGAGELAWATARARPNAQVIGIDISADLLAAAEQRGQRPANLRFELADAATWADPAGPFDLHVSRHGVMFFPDPNHAFAHLAAQTIPGGRIVFSCFRAPADNAWASGIAEIVPTGSATPAPPESPRAYAPGPFAFADPDDVRRWMAGWTDIAFTRVDFDYVAGEGAGDGHAADPVVDALDFFRRIGPAARALRALPESERNALETRLIHLLEQHRSGNRVSFAASAWIVTATADHANR